MELIEIKDLTYTYPGASVPTLRHMNLTVERGDFLAIIGNNGCGKSTLCKTMNGLIPHFISGEMEGKVFIDGRVPVRWTWEASRKSGLRLPGF